MLISRKPLTSPSNREGMKKNKDGCDSATCLMCRLCSREWQAAIAAHRQHFLYKKGEQIFKEGDPVTGIYFIYEGSVKIHKQWGPDKELIVRFAKKGDIFGHRGFGNEPHYPITATALETVSACYIGLDFFYASLKTNTDFLFKLMMFYAEELQTSEKNMRNLAHMPVKGRVATALLRLEERFGRTDSGAIDIVLSRQDLASYAGTTYETVFRLLTEFNNEGIISLAGKDIIIKDKNKLEQETIYQ